MNLNEQAKNVAAQGRFGDSMLLHVNPAEMQGLAQAMPLTINPETGQPEAFLPFLAPVLASTLGGMAGLGLLGTSALSGLATWAVTGDFKKGLLGAVTGYGMGQAANAFSKAGSETLTQNLGQELAGSTLGSEATTQAINQATQQAARDATSGNFLDAIKSGMNPTIGGDALASLNQLGDANQLAAGMTANPTFSQTLGNVGTALAQPASYIPLGIGLGGSGILESQEMFEEDMARRAAEQEERQRKIYEENPEQIPVLYSRIGGKQELQGNPEKERKGYQPGGRFGYGGGGGGMGFPSNPYGGFAGGGFSGLYNAPAMRTPINIPMGIQTGFMPEFSYFNNLNPSATSLTGGQQQNQVGTTVASDETPPVDPNSGFNFNQVFSPTQSAGYRNFYGANQGAPYMLNPYAPISSPYSPPRMMPYGGGFGGMRQPFGGMPSYYPQQSFFQPSPYVAPPPPPPPPPAPVVDTEVIDPPLTDIPIIGGKQGSGGNASVSNNIVYPDPVFPPVSPRISPRISPSVFTLDAVDDRGVPIFGGRDIPRINDSPPPPPVPFGTGIDQQVISDNPVLQRRMAEAAQREVVDIPETYYGGPKVAQRPFRSPMNTFGGRDFAEGGKTEIEGYQEGRVVEPTLEAIDTPIPDASNATPQEIMSDPLTQELIMFIVGESEDIDIVNTFIDKYGNEAYQMIRESVLQQIAPGSQTEGMIRGEGTGYSDSIPGTIGAREQIAVSNQEYIVPSDVLHAIGDGDVEKGGQEMDQFLARTRKESTGTTKAPNRVEAKRMLPR